MTKYYRHYYFFWYLSGDLMEKIKLLIADADALFVQQAKKVLEGHDDLVVAGICPDGGSAVEMVHKLRPDVVMFDLVLPGVDGLSLLKEIGICKSHPMAICCTQFYSPVGLEACRKLGASYFLYKPIDWRMLYETIKGCYCAYRSLQSARKEEMSSCMENTLAIRNYLVTLGIPSRLIGCSYLAEAVRLALKDISLTQNLSKGLYLEISRIMDTTPSCIERCIRNAIGSAYQNGRLSDKMMTCPSNKEFINYVLRTFEG